ncbi:uncharacterized protein FIBRA_06553 [Fibroporia radiculosa]|uniref:Uncharacterized protein n=1 Tax=Fibroporia radiculosa TaxID=599839 RepID=J4H450_9APHY|nr:uncharacterized protein FIBRA_06553 [Fibroporia radiculosa]CCM04379.1 predicted protein [Fibroporia radiculosa]
MVAATSLPAAGVNDKAKESQKRTHSGDQDVAQTVEPSRKQRKEEKSTKTAENTPAPIVDDQGVTAADSFPLILSSTLENPSTDMKAGVRCTMVITCSPGNGAFLISRWSVASRILLHVILGLRANVQLPAILQLYPTRAYLFVAHGVFSLTALDDPEAAGYLMSLIPNAWYLIDSTLHMPVPTDFAIASCLTIVQAASARQKWLKWLDKTPPGLYNISVCMGSFTLEEAIIAYAFYMVYCDTFSDVNFRIPNRRPGEEELRKKATYRIPTLHLTSMVIERFRRTSYVERVKYYHASVAFKRLAAAAGSLFEGILVHRLSLGGSWPLWELVAEDARRYQHWKAGPATSTQSLVAAGYMDVNTTSLQSSIRSERFMSIPLKSYRTLAAGDLVDGYLYVPDSPTEAMYDLFYYRKGTAILF